MTAKCTTKFESKRWADIDDDDDDDDLYFQRTSERDTESPQPAAEPTKELRSPDVEPLAKVEPNLPALDPPLIIIPSPEVQSEPVYVWHDAVPSTPVKRTTEVTVEENVPYKLASVHSGATPDSHYVPMDSFSQDTVPARAQKALLHIRQVLEANSGNMSYTDLHTQCKWRTKFQPKHGSLFTFLKKFSTTFKNDRSIIRLVRDETPTVGLQWTPARQN